MSVLSSCTHQPTNGLALCPACQKTARRGMENISLYHGDLLGLGRQRVVTRRASGFSDPTGLAASASEREEPNAPDIAAYDTRVQLVGWVRALVDDRPQVVMPRNTVEAMAAVLVKRTSTIATLPWAGDYLGGVLGLEQRLHRIVQRSRGYWYAGICSAEISPSKLHDATSCTCTCHSTSHFCDMEGGSCGPELTTIEGEYCDRDLYAIPGATHVRCPACRTNHSVQARRAILLDEARETLLPLGVIAQVCVTLLDGEPSVERLFKRIDNWIRRGAIEDYGVRVLADRRAHRVYRLGDVLNTLIGEAAQHKGGRS